jgi:hypothetical protein
MPCGSRYARATRRRLPDELAGDAGSWEMNITTAQPLFSVRAFLRQREALLVHFNTPMATKHPTGFPDAPILARTLPGPLCFSTIQVGDRDPWQGGSPGDANAGGSVGMVVDVHEQSAMGVDHTDSGFIEGLGSAGRSPTAFTCCEHRSTDDHQLVAREGLQAAWHHSDPAHRGLSVNVSPRSAEERG